MPSRVAGGDGAYEHTRTPLHPVTFRACESGVASDLPPQSKSWRSFRVPPLSRQLAALKSDENGKHASGGLTE